MAPHRYALAAPHRAERHRTPPSLTSPKAAPSTFTIQASGLAYGRVAVHGLSVGLCCSCDGPRLSRNPRACVCGCVRECFVRIVCQGFAASRKGDTLAKMDALARRSRTPRQNSREAAEPRRIFVSTAVRLFAANVHRNTSHSPLGVKEEGATLWESLQVCHQQKRTQKNTVTQRKRRLTNDDDNMSK